MFESRSWWLTHLCHMLIILKKMSLAGVALTYVYIYVCVCVYMYIYIYMCVIYTYREERERFIHPV